MNSEYNAAKRIGSINPLDLDNKPVKVDESTWLAYSENAGWERWHVEIANDTEPNDVSKTIPVGRIALRDPESGKIYSSELPSYIDDMVYGHLTVDTATLKATFTDESNVNADVPNRRTTYTTGDPIPSNLTFVDTTDLIQYRYIESEAGNLGGNVQYGFVRISMSDITPKGWLVIDGDDEYTLVNRTVRAVKPQVVSFEKCTNWCEVSKTGKGFFIRDDEVSAKIVYPVDVSTDGRDAVVHTRNTNDDTFTKLTNTVYRVCINLFAKPKNRSADIVTLSLVLNGTVVSSADVDMSLLPGDYQSVCLMGEVDLRTDASYEWVNNKSITVRLQSSEAKCPISVQCESGYIVELI